MTLDLSYCESLVSRTLIVEEHECHPPSTRHSTPDTFLPCLGRPTTSSQPNGLVWINTTLVEHLQISTNCNLSVRLPHEKTLKRNPRNLSSFSASDNYKNILNACQGHDGTIYIRFLSPSKQPTRRDLCLIILRPLCTPLQVCSDRSSADFPDHGRAISSYPVISQCAIIAG